MAKPKNQKAKPKHSSRQAKQPQAKKRGGGKQNDVTELRAQLDPLGLKIIQVTADGNCFFRALADQLEGDEDMHEKYRRMVVQYIKNNRETFEPFVEDEVPFDDYCRSMGEDSTWAGHMELQAASLVTRSNICIHKNMSPRWYIQNFDKHEARMIHLSYHDGEHYNSVRSKDDTCSGPARLIVIQGDAVLSANTDQPKAASKMSKMEGAKNVEHEGTTSLVKEESGCDDGRKVEQALQQVSVDVDAAVEVLVAEQRLSDQTVAGDEFSESMKFSYDESQHSEQRPDRTCKVDSSGNDAETSYKKNSPQHDDKKISRNKACPCGSKKKYKSCCGTVSGKSSARFSVLTKH
ncbi:hypothetical protein CASFOL_011488 [Castilleja foliolosa]|uniref:OTU domain-containing protein n=1 Tax=Castilleja foliolosa TaxID=1961234 RepID=A0ABD3DW14_9LAMI